MDEKYSVAALLAEADASPPLGVCRECGQILTNPKSIAAGIGPICAGKAPVSTVPNEEVRDGPA